MQIYRLNNEVRLMSCCVLSQSLDLIMITRVSIVKVWIRHHKRKSSLATFNINCAGWKIGRCGKTVTPKRFRIGDKLECWETVRVVNRIEFQNFGSTKVVRVVMENRLLSDLGEIFSIRSWELRAYGWGWWGIPPQHLVLFIHQHNFAVAICTWVEC